VDIEDNEVFEYDMDRVLEHRVKEENKDNDPVNEIRMLFHLEMFEEMFVYHYKMIFLNENEID
jgi:hypothetical protein